MYTPVPQFGGFDEAKQILEKVFECCPDALVVVDTEGRIVLANPQLESMFGYLRSELIGQSVEMLLPERFRDLHPSHRMAYHSQPRMRPMGAGLELYGRRRDGTEFPLDIMLSSVATEKGPFVLTVIRDITRQKRNEEILRQSEQRFRLLVENATDYAIFMLDPAGRIITWNAGAQRLNGYSAEEILGHSFSELHTPEEIQMGVPDRSLRQAETRGRSESEGWRVRKDGSRYWGSGVITAIRDDKGQVAGFAKVSRDLTQHRKIEAILQRSEQQMRALFELSPDAIVTSDAEGRITAANQRVEELFGYKREELLGQSIEILIPERFRGTHPIHRENYSAHPRTRPMGIGVELYGRRKDGTEFPVDIMLAPVDTPQGRIALSTIRDVSERKQAEEMIRRSEEEKRYLQEELHGDFKEIIGQNAELQNVLRQVSTVAPTDATVLVLGETGTGKELIARAIHRLSARQERPFVKLNCAAIPSGLLESELFGHEKGAFTGAISQKIGRLELAHKGTLFLDEVGDIPLELQPKLLRALQEKEFERLGSTRTISVDVRLVAATNRSLESMVAEKQFRSDLYYRLKVFPIRLPPLRDRRDDIPPLAHYFVEMHARRMDKRIETIPREVMDAFLAWRWPGNIRELENFIERAVILTTGSVLRAPLSELQAVSLQDTADAPEEATLASQERDYILRALKEANGVIGGPDGAAARLGLKRTTLNSKMKKLRIERSDYR